MAILEGALDALVQLLIAAGGLDGPYVTAADDGRIRGIEVESEVDLFDGQYLWCRPRPLRWYSPRGGCKDRDTVDTSARCSPLIAWNTMLTFILSSVEVARLFLGKSGVSHKGSQPVLTMGVSAQAVRSLSGSFVVGLTCVSRDNAHKLL